MSSFLKRFTIVVFVINIVLTCFTVYIFFVHEKSETSKRRVEPRTKSSDVYFNDDNWNPWGYDLLDDTNSDKSKNYRIESAVKNAFRNETINAIEIWSKAAIGTYLWEHILKGKIDKRSDSQFYAYGFKRVNNFKIKFRSGPSLNVQSLRQYLTKNSNSKIVSNGKHIILVINGRDKSKVDFSKSYLNELRELKKRKDVEKFDVGLVMLGNENCFNSWINPYLEKYGGFVKFLFIVYDWNAVDNDAIFQWPLGVATYRSFPNPDSNKLNLQLQRPYICNFLGTIYLNASREQLFHFLQKHKSVIHCLVKPRWDWLPNESKESLQLYIEAVKQSDITLSPIGMNHECYRIYEAFAFGSVPVIEENLNHVSGKKSACDHKSAYRMLKKFNAPVIFVKNWTQELMAVIEEEKKRTLEDKIVRRVNLINWYNHFKLKMRDHFLDVVQKKFFS
ncbi:transmembrane protein 5-like protein [Leptotrombidium deliense]|uniref:Transmembrane protein 5-like protein n=1 Tax=Leptotrombidium deliense TaxID=299467 RepID=A0A443SGC1_9ACAR|nr:transmembrane protein 5-like protein [Leptotrombidium deliense]